MVKTETDYNEGLVEQSKTYRKVLTHRKKCIDWGTYFCLECFGGGLTKFTKDLEKEFLKRGMR